MSKKVKKKKTLELKEALVTEEEQPYDLPENWIWVQLSPILEKLESGKRPRGGVNNINEGVPSLGGEHLTYEGGFNFTKIKYVPEEFVLTMTKGIIKKDDILIVKDGATTGKTSFVHEGFPFEKAVINEHIFLCRSSINIYPKYLFYYIISPQGQKNINKNIKGSAQGGINTTFSMNFPVALAPKNEQKRISNKVERLLNKIDEAKQLIDEAKDKFELRRAAILDKAFRGELTEKWRRDNTDITNSLSLKIGKEHENNDFPGSWIVTDFQKIAADEKYSLVIGPFGSDLKVSDYEEEGVPLVFVRNIRSSNYNLETKFVSKEKANDLKAHSVTAGDVLITKMGDPPGDSDLCPDTIEKAIITADCIKLRVSHELVNNKFIMYAIKSSFIQQQIRAHSKGVAQQKISLKIFKEVEVPIPPYNEQIKIVNYIDNYIGAEKEILRNSWLALDALDALKHSILSKAFQGVLGTNNPLEDNSIELLKKNRQ